MKNDEKGLYAFFLIAGILMQLGIGSMFYEFDYATNIMLGISRFEVIWRSFFMKSFILSTLISMSALVLKGKINILRIFSLTQFLFVWLYLFATVVTSPFQLYRLSWTADMLMVSFLMGSSAFILVNYEKTERGKLFLGAVLVGFIYAALIYFAMFHGIGK